MHSVGHVMLRSRLVLLLWLTAVSGCGNPVDVATIDPVDGAVCDAGPLPPGSSLVSIDFDTRFQTIDGFGTTQRLFDDPHVTNTFDPLTKRAAVVVPAAEQAKILAALPTSRDPRSSSSPSPTRQPGPRP